ncbi:MAG TPA: 16S rRNA (cytosine(967)-C(5))-methyltransferase RsmB [Terriglobia bacterium]|nr:16S rRNA (cytosine(967)-C(5))-methyltransferase RsmB [Terriglobia bacterium]
MPISPARETSYRILLHVESGKGYAVDLLQGARVASLKEADRRLSTELTMGTMRRRGELDFWIERLSGKKLGYFDPEIATILRMGLYQILFLEKIPKSAVVNESVEMAKTARKRSATGLVNAVLRKAEPIGKLAEAEVRAEKSASPDAARSAGAVRCLPGWLSERWAHKFGRPAMEALAEASLKVPPTTLRVSAAYGERNLMQQDLAKEGLVTRAGRYARTALIVESGSAQSSAIVRERRAIIQDEGSQLIASIVSPRPGDRLLDLCAAPGIKAGALAALMGPGLLVACDLSAPRLRTMKNLLPGSISDGLHLFLVRLDATRELCFATKFDRILLDAPCSGTGTLTRNPEIKWRLQPDDLRRLAGTQVQMLQNALGSLAPGGRLVYSTCSLEEEENELVVERVLSSNENYQLTSARELCHEFPELSEFFDDHGYFRTRPDLHGMDGFFAAVIRRTPSQGQAVDPPHAKQ